MELTGAQAVIRSLEHEGVDVVFGHPGGAILPAYDPLLDSPIRHYLARHEQGAGHMAEGYAHATGRVGVVIATSGPGGTNLVTALADAHMDSVPVVAITGQVPTGAVGGDAFQEADITGITMPVTKHNEMVYDPARIAGAIREAFHIASTGRPGPVLLDLPKDVLNARFDYQPADRLSLPGYRPTVRGHGRMVREAARQIAGARRPVVYAGGGVLKAGAHAELRRLAEVANLPVVTTLMARGAFPDSHPQCLGMPGMHGHWTAITALQQADLIVALGARFDDRVTGDLSTFAPGAKVVHVDIDPAEIGKNREPDVPIVGDCRVVLGQILEALEPLLAEADPDASTASRPGPAAPAAGPARDLAPWWQTLRAWQAGHPLRVEQLPDGPLKPQTVIRAIGEKLDGRGIVVSGVGQHQMWASQHVRYEQPRSWINSGGLGTMGFCVPAAIGAKVGRPEATVVGIDGDGSFQMTLQELATARTEGVPVVYCVINNGTLGMVRQWQELFYDRRYSSVDLGYDVPDLVKLADAYGCAGFRCERVDVLDSTLDKAFAVRDVPVVVDFRVAQDEKVFPMVPAGASNDHIIESAEEWYAQTGGSPAGGAGEPGGAGQVPAHLREGNVV
jgi:acetolactate synthase-1/2/3 large subunit